MDLGQTNKQTFRINSLTGNAVIYDLVCFFSGTTYSLNQGSRFPVNS